MRCIECKGDMLYKMGQHRIYWGDLHRVATAKYWQCVDCGEKIFEAGEADRLFEIAYISYINRK